MTLTLQNFGEVFMINLDDALYFEADDHYARVYMAQGHKFTVPFCLARIEEAISALPRESGEGAGEPLPSIVRLGRRYIVNMSYVFHVNVLKQAVMLSDNKGGVYTLQVSKAVLRQILDWAGR